MLACMDGKTHSASTRIPIDLYERLQRVKTEQAHKQISDSKFLVEAVRLYVEHAERFGIDDDLVVREPLVPYIVAPLTDHSTGKPPIHSRTKDQKGGRKKSSAG